MLLVYLIILLKSPLVNNLSRFKMLKFVMILPELDPYKITYVSFLLGFFIISERLIPFLPSIICNGICLINLLTYPI